MKAFSFWSASELKEFIKTLEMGLASGAQQVTSPDGSMTLTGQAACWTTLRQLYAAHFRLTGEGPNGSTRPRFVECRMVNGYGGHRPLGRRRGPFEA